MWQNGGETMSEDESESSKIQIKFVVDEKQEAEGELITYLAPRTINSICRILPLESRATIWKEEVYFETKTKIGKEKSTDTVKKGTIAFWPMGSAICIFLVKHSHIVQ